MARVLILSAAVGSGHKAAARAVAEAFAERHPDTEVRTLDILDLAPRLLKWIYCTAYEQMAGTFPAFYAYSFRKTDRWPAKADGTPGKGVASSTFLDRAVYRKTLAAVRDFDPDQIVCTHFLPADVLLGLKRRESLRARVSLVVTDYYMHGYWFSRGADRYFVATDDIRQQIIRAGFAPERVTTSGIPIRPCFAHDYCAKELAAIRADFDFDGANPTLLVCAGGWRSGGAGEILDAALECERPLNVMALVGSNRREIDTLAARTWPNGVRVHAMERTDRMHDLMRIADLVVTKPGGLTSAESLASGSAMMIINPVPGQEEYNADYLLEQGAAVRSHGPVELACKLSRLLTDTEHLARIRGRAKQIARPDAAFRVADAVCSAMEE